MVGTWVGVVALVGCAAAPKPVTPVAVVPPVEVAPAPAPAPPPPPVLAIDKYLVETLPPLGDKHGNADHHATAMTASVIAVHREDDHARVRVHRGEATMDRNWTATFVDAAGKHVADCKIVAWDANELECVTTAPLAKLTPDIQLDPPSRESQIKRVLLAQAQGDELLVTFAAGANDDVDDDWSAALVDDNGAPVPKGDCKIVRISATTAQCRTPAKVDQLWGVFASR
ncbi:MAG: hypothetical protein QM831_11355 [Kofleriaceae bacterium]